MGKNYQYIEVDVTNVCNLKCNNCTRRMDLTNGDKFITLDSLQAFFDDTKHIPFRRIVIMGGEPTLHPDIKTITQRVADYAKTKYKCTSIFVSNCHTQYARDFCNEVDGLVEVRREPKTKTRIGGGARLRDFWTMNIAPIDFPEFQDVNFANGCMQAIRCGINRSVHGKYYACAMAAPIDEIFGFGVGVDSATKLIKSVNRGQFNILCRYCGRLRLEYALDWARFDKPWKEEAFKESQKEWPLRSGNLYLSKSWTEALNNGKHTVKNL